MRHSLFLLFFLCVAMLFFLCYSLPLPGLGLSVLFCFLSLHAQQKTEKGRKGTMHPTTPTTIPCRQLKQNSQQDATRQGDILKFPFIVIISLIVFHDTTDPTKRVLNNKTSRNGCLPLHLHPLAHFCEPKAGFLVVPLMCCCCLV